MGHREDYQIPDWVVKDYNSRVPKEDRLPLYDGTDDSEYEYSSAETSSHDKIMIALNKAIRTGDYEEYDKLKLEERMLWWGARGFTKEQILDMFDDNKPPTLTDEIKFNIFRILWYALVFFLGVWLLQ